MDYRRKIDVLTLLPRSYRRSREVKRYREEIDVFGERELVALREFVEPGMLALDVDCNRGVYAYALSQLSARVIAFEPNPALAKLVASLGLPGVTVRRIALSSEDGVAELTAPDDIHGWATLRALPGQQRARVDRVETARLDGLDIRGIDFIKVDVEGFEEEVLGGAGETIARDRPVLLIEIEERHNPGGFDRIARSMEARGYTALYRRDGGWRPVGDAGIASLQDVGLLEREMNAGVLFRDCTYVNNFLFVPDHRLSDFV